ncbi:MAG: helix-hairpin-helix domain-containing protein [Ruminococcaceae bacterium]|nr:helix-hairpin-helix domain-containing protein [Oscillospiraceae bacterium]
MKTEKIAAAAKYTAIALAGCAVVAVAVENLSPNRKNDAPLLTATSISSSTHSENSTASSTRTVSTSVSSTVTAQSSTSVASETSEAPEPAISESEPHIDEPDDPYFTYEPATEEPTYEPEPSSETSEEFTGETSEPDTSEITPPTSEAASSEPPITSSEPPVLPEIPEFVIVNLNTATVAELTQLDGIGEERALAIIAFREQFGGFTSIYEVRDVDGIGDATFEKIRDFIVI